LPFFEGNPLEVQRKIEIMRKMDLFQALDDPILEQLASNCREFSLEPEEMLFEENTLETAMYLILSGDLLVFKGVKQIALLSAGQYVGEMSLIESKPRSASTKAVSQCLLLEISEVQFNQYLATEPKALTSIIRTLCARIRTDLAVMSNDLQKANIFTHDIKNCLTPLGLVEMYLEDLIEVYTGENGQRKRSGVEDLEKSFEVMDIVKNNLMTMINQSLMNAKKIKVDYQKSSHNVMALIRETLEQVSCHKNLEEKNIEITDFDKDAQWTVNFLDIKRVIQNTIINAGYVTKKGGTINVDVKSVDESFQVSITDYGCGIPEDIQPLLLKESITTKGDEGNGLGLLSCREIIQDLHGGKFWFESKVGEGTTFFFTIPEKASEAIKK